MAESGFKGKSLKAIMNDVAEGLISINPLFLKKFDAEMIKELYEGISKTMTLVRNEKVLFNDTIALRNRNLKLQRLHNALIIVKNTAREKRFRL
ncbi:MAG TPA: hypothetical protein VN604_02025 [Nitrospirota bacterium]|nr:hypothetical protein [Nitrospirota bacterium]